MSLSAGGDHSTVEDSTIAAIAAIFEEVLRHPNVQADDDFFDLGGDSLAAMALVLAIEKIGVELPVSVLFEAPTVSQLARAVEGFHASPQPALVVLKTGDAAQPVFIAPGAGGSVLELVSFARKVDTDRQIYGLQARDDSGRELVFATIEEGARFYLELIRSVQPRGPYLLAGYSMGGLTALELGQAMVAAEEHVALLVMLDTLTMIELLPWHRKIRFWLRRAAHHGGKMRRIPASQWGRYLVARANGLARDLGGTPAGRSEPASTGAATGIKTAAAIACLNYRPRSYPGTISFIRARGSQADQGHYPDLMWGGFARRVIVHTVDGDHWTMITNNAARAAKVFSACLANADLSD